MRQTCLKDGYLKKTTKFENTGFFYLAIDPKFRILRCISLILGYSELKAHLVNGCLLSASKVLQHSSQEGLGKIKTGNPKHSWRPVVNPLLEELQSD